MYAVTTFKSWLSYNEDTTNQPSPLALGEEYQRRFLQVVQQYVQQAQQQMQQAQARKDPGHTSIMLTNLQAINKLKQMVQQMPIDSNSPAQLQPKFQQVFQNWRNQTRNTSVPGTNEIPKYLATIPADLSQKFQQQFGKMTNSQRQRQAAAEQQYLRTKQTQTKTTQAPQPTKPATQPAQPATTQQGATPRYYGTAQLAPQAMQGQAAPQAIPSTTTNHPNTPGHRDSSHTTKKR